MNVTSTALKGAISSSSNQITCDDVKTPAKTSSQETIKKREKGVSVYYLKNIFLKNIVEVHGMPLSSKIYQLENLQTDECGVIRKKGEGISCPHDGEVGAAFVDCLSDIDHVGLANLMLSYSWGYTIGDIVETMVEFSKQKKLDPKRTYVYICCLCINQFRVRDTIRSNTEVPFSKFQENFRNCVIGIGYVVAMMQPWNEALYLKRVWCIFEAFTASRDENCKLEIVMPAREKKAMVDALNDDDYNQAVDTLSKVLVATKVENAEATMETDRKNILEMVKSHYSGYDAFNNEVNELVRKWMKESLTEAIDRCESQSGVDSSSNEELAKLCLNLGYLFGLSLGELPKAIELTEKALEISITVNGEDDNFSATCYDRYGECLSDAGRYDEAIEKLEKSIQISERINEEETKTLATAYDNIGNVFSRKDQYDDALQNQQKSLDIRTKILKENHPNIATSHNNIAAVLKATGNLDGALESFQKALEIYKIAYGNDHPYVATVSTNIAIIYCDKNMYEKSLEFYNMALEIQKKVLGDDNVTTALTYSNIGFTLCQKGDYNGALEYCNMALEIEKKVLGKDHTQTTTTRYWRDYATQKLKVK